MAKPEYHGMYLNVPNMAPQHGHLLEEATKVLTKYEFELAIDDEEGHRFVLDANKYVGECPPHYVLTNLLAELGQALCSLQRM